MVIIEGLHDLFLSYSKVPPCLPYVGAYLDMIYSLKIGVETYNSNGLVNFSKMTKVRPMVLYSNRLHCVAFSLQCILSMAQGN